MSARLRAAVVGCGDISAVHLDALLADPDVHTVGVCDVDPDRRSAAAQRAGCAGFADVAAMLTAVAPDVVHVCTPHHLHAEQAAECLAGGISVLLEKPVARTVAEAERLAIAAGNSSAVLGVCFQNRYNATSRALRDRLDEGSLGRVLGGRASVTWSRDAAYYAHRSWRGRWASAGGGVLMNQAIHTLDLLQWFLGPVSDVRGTAATLALAGVIEVEDTAAIQLHHRTAAGDVVPSVFHATNGHVENAPITVEIRTELATLRLDTELTVTHVDGRVETVAEAATAAGERSYWGASHALLIRDFHQHVRAGKDFWIDVPAALETLRIIDAVYANSPNLDRHALQGQHA
ncbi:Gfo/Idh/MocA family protein [Pseudonocardia sp. GCM10023141]|uniref:Gfo/Idh/MocA family protein n=1 Tax=Pseudonocardia sp. GCM10023141 TaxID=3252653 RepID=UPI003614F42E